MHTLSRSFFPSAARALRGLPLLLDQHSPEPERIPAFLLALGRDTCWEAEKECFSDVVRHLGDFYAVRPSLRELAEEAEIAAAAAAAARGAEGGAEVGEERGGGGAGAAAAAAGGDAAEGQGAGKGKERAAGPPRSGPIRAEREWVIAQVSRLLLLSLSISPLCALFSCGANHFLLADLFLTFSSLVASPQRAQAILPAARVFLRPPKRFAEACCVLQIASLEQLYRVFERC